MKKYLTPRILKMQHNQMNKSLLYHAKRIDNLESMLNYEV